MSMFHLRPPVGFSWQLVAGLGWIAIMLICFAFAIGTFWTIFALPAALVAYVAGVPVPSLLLSSIWGDRSPRGALIAAIYAAAWSVGVGLTAGLTWAAPFAALTAMSAAAAEELRSGRRAPDIE